MASNNFAVNDYLAKETLMQLKNLSGMAAVVDRSLEKNFVGDWRTGGTIRKLKPQRFKSTDGATVDLTGLSDETIDIPVNLRKNIAFSIPTQDLKISSEGDKKRLTELYIKPGVTQLVSDMNRELTGCYKDVMAAVGTAGTPPAAYSVITAAKAKQAEYAVPIEEANSLHLMLNPQAMENMAPVLTTLLNAQMVEAAWKTGKLPETVNYRVKESQHIRSHTAGVPGGTPRVKGAGQTGKSLVMDGMTATTGTYKKGDIITIADVYQVNPLTREQSRTGSSGLQQFVITADATADGTGDATLSIYPAIIVSGAYQTVNALPADNALITLVASHVANLAFHKQAFHLACVPLPEPEGAVFSQTVADEDSGLTIRLVKDYEFTNDLNLYRLDCLFGAVCQYPEMAVRVLG